MSNIQQIAPYGSAVGSQVPQGIEPVWGSKGEKVTAYSQVTDIPGTRVAPPSGVPYVAKTKRCAWNDYKCQGAKFSETELCFGHFQRFLKGRTSELKGDELSRLELERPRYEEIERKRLEDKAQKKEEHWAEHGPKDQATPNTEENETPEVTDAP
jgi:hypothetical protein